FGDATYFRTAMSAGNLHPVEIYVVCGGLDRVPAGVHHFAPLDFGLTELRRRDYRGPLAVAAADRRIAEAPVTLVLTGIPWVTAARRDGALADGGAAVRWRTRATSLGEPAAGALEPPRSASEDPIEVVILRRGSTRLMRRETVRPELLTWGLSVAARVVLGDVARDPTLLEHFVLVHDVEGVASGAYRYRGDRLEQGREGQHRDLAAHLCFDQPLGGDSA